jgi:hypothetical protein
MNTTSNNPIISAEDFKKLVDCKKEALHCEVQGIKENNSKIISGISLFHDAFSAIKDTYGLTMSLSSSDCIISHGAGSGDIYTTFQLTSNYSSMLESKYIKRYDSTYNLNVTAHTEEMELTKIGSYESENIQELIGLAMNHLCYLVALSEIRKTEKNLE